VVKSFGLPVLLALGCAPACVDIVALDSPRHIEREEKRFTVTGRPDLRLATFDGAIEIRPWDRPEVLVVVEKRGVDSAAVAAIRVQAEQTGDRISVTADVPSGSISFNQRRSAALIVSVPRSADVEARTSDGGIDVEQLAGRIALRTGDGGVRAHAITGDLRVQTGDGAINTERLDGTLDANTGDGRIAVRGRFSSIRAHTGDGSVTVQAEPGSAPAHDWDITTGDGAVVLELPEGFGAQIDAHSGDGRVDVTDLTVSDVTGRLGRQTLRGRLGPGGRSVRVRTGDGSITMRRY
jgi:hypothetical protein